MKLVMCLGIRLVCENVSVAMGVFGILAPVNLITHAMWVNT